MCDLSSLRLSDADQVPCECIDTSKQQGGAEVYGARQLAMVEGVVRLLSVLQAEVLCNLKKKGPQLQRALSTG